MHIVVTGNTGSGKTAVSKALAAEFEIPLVSSGDIAREMSQADVTTDLALQQGEMAPEAAMRVAVRARLEEADAKRGGWILEGFPRSTEQLICLMQWTAALPTFIHIDVATWTCIERLLARQRTHDNPDSIGRRLKHFENETVPMITILLEAGILKDIDGGMALEDVIAHAKEYVQ